MLTRVRKAYSQAKGNSGGSLIKYGNYIGKVEYDDEAGLFHGEVINLRDVITFQGDCVEDLRRAFKDSVEDYLDFCKERGENPEKPFSGKFVLRVDPELHQEISQRAQADHISLNQWINSRLEEAVI